MRTEPKQLKTVLEARGHSYKWKLVDAFGGEYANGWETGVGAKTHALDAARQKRRELCGHEKPATSSSL